MLVVQGGAVDPGRGVTGVTVGILILGNELLAAAGVTGEGVAVEGLVGEDQAHLCQRIHSGNEAGGVAAGVGHPLGFDDGLPVAGGELGEAVVPAGGGTVGGGGVDDPGVGVFDHSHGLTGSVIGETQEDQVGGVQKLLPLGGVLALFVVDEQQLDVGAGGEPVIDLQTGGALLAVNVYFGFHGVLLVTVSRPRRLRWLRSGVPLRLLRGRRWPYGR